MERKPSEKDMEYLDKWTRRSAITHGISDKRLIEICNAERDGRCVILPVPMHRMLLDVSDPINPELLKDFRISATWDHRGIVFHSPWGIFLENIQKGYIRLINENAEAALKGELT